MSNCYYVCPRTRPPVRIDLGSDRPVPEAEIAYFIRGFRLLEAEYDFDGRTVCFAWSIEQALPRLGPDVIAVIYGDEHCRVPAYAGEVGAVIKCHGFFPNFTPRLRPLRLAQIEAVEFGRNLLLWLPTGWRWLVSRRVRARCQLVPLGYGLPLDAPPVPFAERRFLASFLGSVAGVPPGQRLRALLGTPKSFSRARMLRALGEVRRRHGAERVEVSVTGSFQESLQRERPYAEVMMQTRICVAPRGTAHETLRVYEGLRAGCVVITDRLPRHPFYRNSPILQINDWRDLPDLIDDLARDPARMHDLHERGLRHWYAELSEAALARRCAAVLGLRRRDRVGRFDLLRTQEAVA